MDVKVNIMDGQTEGMRRELIQSEDIQDVKEIMNKNSAMYTDWKKFINNINRLYGYNYQILANKCGFSVNTIKKWCNNGDMPRTREGFIKLGFGLKMDQEHISELLQRYGKYSKLYPKNIKDSVYIFCISKQKDFNYAQKLLETFADYYKKTRDINNGKVNYNEMCTERVQKEIVALNEESEFIDFIKLNIQTFDNVYGKLINFIESYIKIKTVDYTKFDYIRKDDKINNEKFFASKNANYFLEENIKNPKIIKCFNSMISNLTTKKEIPNREKLIAFGIHLTMSLNDIDSMLNLAGMEGLCAKDRVESAIIYAVEDAFIRNPDIEITNQMLLKNFTDNPEIKERCYKIISDYWNTDYKSEYSKESVAEYVADTLINMEIEDSREILSLLNYN